MRDCDGCEHRAVSVVGTDRDVMLRYRRGWNACYKCAKERKALLDLSEGVNAALSSDIYALAEYECASSWAWSTEVTNDIDGEWTEIANIINHGWLAAEEKWIWAVKKGA